MTALPPGPSYPPVVQTYLALRNPFAFLDECAARYGDFFTTRFVGAPTIVNIDNPEAIREVFGASPEQARAGEANLPIEFLLGRGSLLMLDGKRHERERRLLMPSFHGERMSAYLSRMVAATEHLVDRTELGQTFSLHEAMQTITLDVIMECVFGMAPGPRYDRLQELLKRLMTLGSSPAAAAFTTLINGSRLRELLVARVAPLAERLATLGGLDRALPLGELARCLRDVEALLYEDMAERRASGTKDRDDVMSMLMEARDETGRGLSREELRDEMITLLIAGYETTATTLTFALYELSTRPDVHEVVKAELGRVAGKGPLTAEAIRELRYIDALLKETLRLYGPASGFRRKLAEPMRLGGYDLPAGVLVTASTYLLHRNPRIWPDPLRFDPARFLDQRPRPGEFIPFGGGPRTCLGMAFALFEAKTVVATLLTRAELRPAPAPPLRLAQRGFVFGPSHAAPFVLESRTPKVPVKGASGARSTQLAS